MKIIINETQYRNLILKEQKDTFSDFYDLIKDKDFSDFYERFVTGANPYVGIESKNGLVSVKDLGIMEGSNIVPINNLILSPNKNYRGELWLNILTKKNSLLIIESVTFSDTSKGGTIERFTQKPMKPRSIGYIVFNLKPNNTDKEKSFVQLTLTVKVKVVNSNERDVLEIPIRYEIDSLDNELKSCKSKYNYQELKKATDWFKNWFSNPVTKIKFGKNFKYDDKKVEEIFKNYFNILNQIKIEYVFSSRPNGAWVWTGKSLFTSGHDIPITINCSAIGDSPRETFIHEIQHILDSYHKLHPYENSLMNIIRSFTEIESQRDNSDVSEKLRKLLEKEGFDSWASSKLVSHYEWKLENDKIHLKDSNEIMSALYETRKELNLKPTQQITKKMLIDNVDLDGVTQFLCQWIFSKMTLNNWINHFNSVAINKNTQDNSLA
jgi:hypothetical protein